MANSPNPERFAEILNVEIKALADKEQVYIPAIELELGHKIGKKSGASIERWRTNRVIPAKHEDVERLAEALRRKGRLQGPLYEEFLRVGGHPNPTAIIHPPPLSLPQLVEYFTGRNTEIENLIDALQPGRVVTLYGPGGVGKTALVAEVLQRLAPKHNLPKQFPDGIFYHDFRIQSSIDTLFELFAHFFHEELWPTLHDAVRRALFSRQALLVLDSAEEVDDLIKVLSLRGKCTVLLVTRDRRIASGRVIWLNMLPLEQAITVLQAWSMDEQDQSTFKIWRNEQEANDTIAKEICELVGCLPLALRIAGSYMSQCMTSALEFLELLKATPLTILHQGKSEHQSIPILLEKILERVGEQARDVLAILGFLAYTPFDLEVVAAALETSVLSIRPAIGILTRFSLVNRMTNDQYQVVHRLIYLYAQERMPIFDNVEDDISYEVTERLVNYYSRMVKRESELGLKGYTRLHTERAHMSTVLAGCVKKQIWVGVLQLAGAIGVNLDAQGYSTERITAGQEALKAARALGDSIQEIYWLHQLGITYFKLKQFKVAIDSLEQSLTLGQESGLDFLLRFTSASLGEAFKAQGQNQTAVEYYKRAIDFAQHYEDRQNEGRALVALGNLYVELEQVEAAIDSYQQALPLFRETGDRTNEGITLRNLGDRYGVEGQHQTAVEYYQQALIIARESSNLDSARYELYSHCLYSLGYAYQNIGLLDEAVASYQQALYIAQEYGDYSTEIDTLGKLGDIYYTQRQLDKAIDYFQHAQALAKDTESHNSEGTLFDKLGAAHLSLGNSQNSINFYLQALNVWYKLGNRFREGLSLLNLGITYQEQDQWTSAIDSYQQALSLFREIGDRTHEGGTLYNLGQVYSILGQDQTAVEYYQQGLIIAKEIDDQFLTELVLIKLGNSYSDLGLYEEAIIYYQKAIELNPNRPITYSSLAIIYVKVGQFDKAKWHYQRRIELDPLDTFITHVDIGLIALLQDEEAEAQKYFIAALDMWKTTWEKGRLSPYTLFESVAFALLCLGYTIEALEAFKAALAQRQSHDVISFITFDLLANAPHPPLGLVQMRNLLNEAIEQEKK